jgi:DNA-binding MarR family transcriptional regulator
MVSYREVHPCEPSDETADEPETRPTPRIMVNLQAEKRETKREPAKAGAMAQEKALRILKRTPEITASELAKRAGCTPQYAGRLLKKQSIN